MVQYSHVLIDEVLTGSHTILATGGRYKPLSFAVWLYAFGVQSERNPYLTRRQTASTTMHAVLVPTDSMSAYSELAGEIYQDALFTPV